MDYFRWYKDGEFSDWKCSGMTLAEKLPFHRQSKVAIDATIALQSAPQQNIA